MRENASGVAQPFGELLVGAGPPADSAVASHTYHPCSERGTKSRDEASIDGPAPARKSEQVELFPVNGSRYDNCIVSRFLVFACFALFVTPACPISLLIPDITSQLESSSSLNPFRFPFTDSLLFDLSHDLSLFCPLTLIPPPELPNSCE